MYAGRCGGWLQADVFYNEGMNVGADSGVACPVLGQVQEAAPFSAILALPALQLNRSL